jgi:hypothetical protein
MEPVFWIAIFSNVATLGIAAAVFIPLSRAAARRLTAPRADAERMTALEAELEAAQARIAESEERLAFLEKLLERGRQAPELTAGSAPVRGSAAGASRG